MAGLLGSVAAYTVLGVLALAAADHLASPDALSRALTAHRTLPAPRLVAVLVISVELGIVVLGGIAVSTPPAGWLRVPVLTAAAGLFAGYGGYTQHVRSRRPGSPCGCSDTDLPVTGWVVFRACLLAVLAVAGATLPGSTLPGSTLTADPPGGAPLVVTLLAAATFSVLLWRLPAAMQQPGNPSVTRPREDAA